MSVRLKKIEIFGFKSFADKIELEFDVGITAVVGPNGCGKSNIADAFRWVLGEQSAKSMRGATMPDVIFAGTTSRKPLNFAEVTITLCNECGLLPIEFSEVALTRRLHKDGSSDYFINRNPVRMKDLNSLLLDSGMGKNAFAIFEQGKIDQVIQFSPLERRYIFEEAAGILRFLQRKKEALRKLEESDQNLLRVKDIHEEQEKQIVILQAQAEKARIFSELKLQLESLEKAVYLRKWQKSEKKFQELQEKSQELEKGNKQLQLQLEGELKQLHEAKVASAQSEQLLKTKNEEFFKAKSDKELKTLEKKTTHERLKEVLKSQKNLKEELEKAKEKQALNRVELKNAHTRKEQLDVRVLQEEEKLKKRRDALNLLEINIGKLRENQQREQAISLQLMQAENRLESEERQNSVRLENYKERQSQFVSRKERLISLMDESSSLAKEKTALLHGISDSIDKKKASLLLLEEQLADVALEIKETHKKEEQLLQEQNEVKARQKALNSLKKEMEGFSSGSKRLLQESAKEKGPLFQKLQPLYELIQPKEKAMALKAYAETLVVKSLNDFHQVIAFAKSENLKSFSLVCQELISQNVDLNTHFLNHVVVVKELEDAFKGANEAITDGFYIDLRQVVFCAKENENNSFLREAELEALQKKLIDLQLLIQEWQTKLQTVESKKNQLQTELRELDKTIRKEEMTLVETNFLLQRVKGDCERYNSEKTQIGIEEMALLESIKKLEEEVSLCKQNHIEAKLKASEKQKLELKLTEEVQKQAESYALASKDFQVVESAFQRLVDESRKTAHAVNVFEIKDLESDDAEKRFLRELESMNEMHAQILSKTANFELSLENCEKALRESAYHCEKMEEEVFFKRQTIATLEKSEEILQSKLKERQSEQQRAHISLAEVQTSLKYIESEVVDRYQMSIEEVKDLKCEIDHSLDLDKEIRLLKKQMEEAGDINMTAIEELKTRQTKTLALTEQLEDLRKSSKELLEIITDLSETSRKIFKETFEVIRENFRKNFQILFNGGEADLEFTESNDLLQAGIEITAKPPGKAMRTMSLLSGGEKCLTAMALLFAIFEVKPAPFCILDEIDAPLDDSNVERFVNVVKQFIDRCQFIIITHNKRTMAIADKLFGVTMEEEGVSKLLSIQFSKEASVV